MPMLSWMDTRIQEVVFIGLNLAFQVQANDEIPQRLGGLLTTWQALTGQAATAPGVLNLATEALFQSGLNYGQAAFNILGAPFGGSRIIGSLK